MKTLSANPSLFEGVGAWDALRAAWASRGIRRVFLVCGDTVHARLGIASRLAPWEADGFVFRRFAGFTPNPRMEAAEAAFAECADFRADALLAIGGGSAIDVAKGVRHRWIAAHPEVSLPFVAAPTTAGTGSEATRFAVLYVDGRKTSLDAPELRPDAALLDPSLTATLSPYGTATPGLDAIAQAIESYWSVRSSAESQAFSREALSLLLPAIRDAVRTRSPESRAAMLRGAYLAGRAIDLTRTTAAHAFSYAFTSAHGIPHGHAVWLTLPALARYNAAVTDSDCQDPRGAEVVRARMAELARIVAGTPDAEAFADALRRLAADLGVEQDPFRLGVADETELHALLSKANPERMSNNPRAMDLALFHP